MNIIKNVSYLDLVICVIFVAVASIIMYPTQRIKYTDHTENHNHLELFDEIDKIENFNTRIKIRSRLSRMFPKESNEAWVCIALNRYDSLLKSIDDMMEEHYKKYDHLIRDYK